MDQKYLVIGASRGIGLGMVRAILARGRAVVATSRDGADHAAGANWLKLDLNVRALIVTPICAHTFNIRPLIIQEDDTVHVAIASIPQDTIITFDGQVCYRLLPGDEVIVKKSEAQAEIIKFEDKDYYQILRTKLWRPAGD